MSPEIEDRLTAAAALRDLNHAFVAHDADAAELRRLTEDDAATPPRCSGAPGGIDWH